MRTAARIDDNQLKIVQTFRSLGFSVISIAAVGCGCPDLIVARNGIIRLIEIKDGSKPPSERRLTPDQEKFHAEWKATIPIVTSVEDVIKLAENWKHG